MSSSRTKPSRTSTSRRSKASERPIIKLVDHIVAEGIQVRASDIHLEAQEGGIVVNYRIDGVLRQAMVLPRPVGMPLVSRIKIMADLDIADRLRPQDGRARVTVNGNRVDLRVSTLPASTGEKVVIRILDSRSTVLTLEGLGLSPREQDRLHGLLNLREGIVLVTGPTGSGKTTTLYSGLRTIQTPRRQHRHGRRSGRIQAERRRAGAGEREGRPHVRGGAALDPAPGPRRGARW